MLKQKLIIHRRITSVDYVMTDEIVYLILREYSKLSQKEYKRRHDWLGKVIHWELYKRLIFDYANKWYMHKSESMLENETHKIFHYFAI